MVDRSDDKSANWREKYLDALDQQDQIEKSLVAQQELLRRALVRVSVVADGQDDTLDGILGQLRERMRGSIAGDITSLLARLDEVALNFEQQRDQNSLDVRTSLMETIKPLQALDLTRGVKKEISQYLAQLPERSKKVRLYPALLQQLASIQQQALKEIEQPKVGFLQKILGTQNPSKPIEKTAPENNENEAQIALAVSVDAVKPALETVDRVATDYAANNAELTGAIYSPPPLQINDDQLTDGELSQKFVEQITQVINQFLVGLEKEAPMVKKVQVIRERLTAVTTADAFIKTLEELRDLMMQSYLSANQAFATYLKNVNQELADIYGLVGGAVESESSRRNASESLQSSVRKEMETLESSTESATDLAQLKNLVQSQIGNIRQALDHYQQSEQAQGQLTSHYCDWHARPIIPIFQHRYLW
jgi:diguanylate cyclase